MDPIRSLSVAVKYRRSLAIGMEGDADGWAETTNSAAQRNGDDRANYRQLPITDAKGLTYTTSVRDVEPQNALETLVRHFTDSQERKQERLAVADAKADQLRMAQMQSRDARDYSVIRDKIARDFYRAAGVSERAVTPELSGEQIAELGKYADTLPFLSTDRMELKEAVRAQKMIRSYKRGAALMQVD